MLAEVRLSRPLWTAGTDEILETLAAYCSESATQDASSQAVEPGTDCLPPRMAAPNTTHRPRTACPPRDPNDLHRLNENDYHNGVHLQLTTSTGRTGRT
jgi:hypothetical protein